MPTTLITIQNEKASFPVLIDENEARARNQAAVFGNQIHYVIYDDEDVLDEAAIVNLMSNPYERQASPLLKLVPVGASRLKRVYVQVSNILHFSVTEEESFLGEDDNYGRMALRMAGEQK